MQPLPEWFIGRIATDADISFKIRGEKAPIHCPFHDDRTRSAIITARNVFFCSHCTPDKGLSAKAFAERLGMRWEFYVRGGEFTRRTTRPTPRKDEQTFAPQKAQAAWSAFYRRARNDDLVEEDREAYRYIASRQLTEAIELGCVGIVGENDDVPSEVSRWWVDGYRVAAPLYDQQGVVTSLQARAIRPTDIKTLFPSGSRIKGTFFADSRALEIVRTNESKYGTIVLGEGLTDLLALAIASPVPVITAPGTGSAKSCVGAWAKNHRVLLALDRDGAGRTALDPVAQALHRHGVTRVQRIGWPKGLKDACDVLAQHGAVGLAQFLRAQLAKGAA